MNKEEQAKVNKAKAKEKFEQAKQEFNKAEAEFKAAKDKENKIIRLANVKKALKKMLSIAIITASSVGAQSAISKIGATRAYTDFNADKEKAYKYQQEKEANINYRDDMSKPFFLDRKGKEEYKNKYKSLTDEANVAGEIAKLFRKDLYQNAYKLIGYCAAFPFGEKNDFAKDVIRDLEKYDKEVVGNTSDRFVSVKDSIEDKNYLKARTELKKLFEEFDENTNTITEEFTCFNY